MADHPRKTIRDEVVKRLKNHTNAGAKVYANRVRPVQVDELPLILVYTREEPVNFVEELNYERNLDLKIEILAEANDTLDDTLDFISGQVEEIMNTDEHLTISGKDWVNEIRFDGTVQQTVKEGAEIEGSSVLTYQLQYYVRPLTGFKIT